MSPCSAPECGPGKRESKSCRAHVISYCDAPGGNRDPGCRGKFYRSKEGENGPEFLRGSPRVNSVAQNAFDLLVVTPQRDQVRGSYAVFQNDQQPRISDSNLWLSGGRVKLAGYPHEHGMPMPI